MARKDWSFVEEGQVYQYKEEWLICFVEILEDLSTKDTYKFKVRVVDREPNTSPDTFPPGTEFTAGVRKNLSGVYSGMSQLYKEQEYYRAMSGEN